MKKNARLIETDGEKTCHRAEASCNLTKQVRRREKNWKEKVMGGEKEDEEEDKE